jgi:predicted NBD/HSP70 family sugar kinase
MLATVTGKTIDNVPSVKKVQFRSQYARTNFPSIINRLIKYFGLTISNIINAIDPDVIVLGGGVLNIPILYDAGVEEVRKNVLVDWSKTPILKADLCDSAGVFGAAYLYNGQ